MIIKEELKMERRLLESTPYEGLKHGTHIDVEVTYSKDRSPRGYYIRVSPVTHENGMESFILFSDISQLLMKTNRYSDKQFEQAVELGRAAAPELIKQVLEREKAA